MDRFKLDDMEDEFDTVEPMRPSSFDMSFTLSSSRVGAAADEGDDDDAYVDDDEGWATTNWAAASRTMLVDDPQTTTTSDNSNDQSSLHLSRHKSSPHEQQQHSQRGERKETTTSAAPDSSSTNNNSSRGNNNKNSVATIALKLEEKAHEAISLASLCGKVPWRLAKRNQDVHIYRPATLPEEEQTKLYFRISCEVKANLSTILEYLTPNDTKSYVDIESQVFPGLLHASVIKRMELPENCIPSSIQQPQEPLSRDNASSYDDDTAENFPRLQVKWHASRFAGRFVKPVDFFFVEYANVETMADGRKRGFGYMRSVESFKGDELATRLHSDDVTIPQSVSKCKRAVINKGIYLVSPSNDSSGTYEVTFMMVIDFQQQFTSSIGAKIIQNFTDRLMGIRELLFNTLFQPVTLVTKDEWKPARSNKCTLCHSSFSFVKLMHHCRACGEAVCSQCSRKWVVQPGAQKETLKRLCTSCSLQARSYLMGGDQQQQNKQSPAAASRKISASQSMENFRMTTGSAAAFHSRSSRMLSDPVLTCDVKVASAVSTDTNHFNAISLAFRALTESLGGVAPHFMVVSYTKEYDGNAIYDALAHFAPDTLFMGGTSSAGVFSERGAVGRGPGLALWGIYDPEGSYSVLNADLMTENPRDASRRCVLQSMEMLCMAPEENPDFIWMSVCTGSEEIVTGAVNEVVDCSVAIVGGSSTRNHIGASTIPATQICSEGSNVGCVTTHGACFAICCPSVEVSHALFTCYEPKDTAFAVTKASGRELISLDHKAAFTTLNEACHGMLYEFVNRPERFNMETHQLPMFYPIARERKEPHEPKATPSRFQVIQPEFASRDLALHLGVSVKIGERLRIMSIAPENVKDKITVGYRASLRSALPALDSADVIGCLTSIGLCYSKILNNDLKTVTDATTRMFPNAAVLGSVSHGQQGVFQGTGEAVHSNGMVSSLLITNRKKLQRLTHLQPLSLRRISTY
ncbi:hypothetical protein Gpo141_00004042 [Globisporangium polare]